MWSYNYTYISHSGIKGMKWGIRRYQNEDGTYTSLGKERRRINPSEDCKKYASRKDKKISEMSNAELRAHNERARLENEYRKLNPGAIKKGLLYIGAISAGLIAVNTLVSNSKPLIAAARKYVPKVISAVKHPGKTLNKAKIAAKRTVNLVKRL